MLEIVFFCILSSISFFSAGQIFTSKLILSKVNLSDNAAISIIFGILILGFLALFINFFISLDLIINTSIFFLLIIFFLKYILNNINKAKGLIIDILIISIIAALSIYLSNINRPDAGLYHLPFTKILNDSKIIFGSSNIHFRFGHISLIQYSNAINFNIIFKEKGILIPQGLLIFSTLYFFGKEFFLKIKKKDLNIDTIFIFICFGFSVLNYNRYSSFGNDAGGNILFIFLIYKTFNLIRKKIINNEDIILLLFVALFCFAQKSFLIFSFLIPFFLFLKFYKNEFIKIFYSKDFLILFFLFSILFLKNVIISGCLIYPSQVTCFKNLSWYNNDTTSREEIMAEAWAKDWINYKNKIEPEKYIKNFNWIKTWYENHFQIIIKKFSQFLIFLFILFFLLIFAPNKNEENKINTIEKKIFNILTITCSISFIFWFIKFPLYRYGSGIIGGLSILFFIQILYKKIKKANINKFSNYFMLIFLLLISGVLVKNFMKIKDRYNIYYNNYPWPKIYSLTDKLNELDNLNYEEYKVNKKFMYYVAKDSYCMYGPSPCTYYIENKLIKKKLFNYDVYLVKE